MSNQLSISQTSSSFDSVAAADMRFSVFVLHARIRIIIIIPSPFGNPDCQGQDAPAPSTDGLMDATRKRFVKSCRAKGRGPRQVGGDPHCKVVNSCFFSKHFERLVGAGLALPLWQVRGVDLAQGGDFFRQGGADELVDAGSIFPA